MATFKISGIWKDADGVVTHYAFHNVKMFYTTRAKKTSKNEAIRLLKKGNNIADTWIWNNDFARFDDGQKVEVINDATGKYLRTDADNKLTDNLGHLIDFDWIR